MGNTGGSEVSVLRRKYADVGSIVALRYIKALDPVTCTASREGKYLRLGRCPHVHMAAV
jgi:hypothetical protein